MTSDDKSNYFAKYQDERWKMKSREVLERDRYECQRCSKKDKSVQAHHMYYDYDKDPWDYPLEAFKTLCSECHAKETSARRQDKLKAIRSIKGIEKEFFQKELEEISKALDQHQAFRLTSAGIASAFVELLACEDVQLLLLFAPEEFAQFASRISYGAWDLNEDWDIQGLMRRLLARLDDVLLKIAVEEEE
jgi:cytochrome c553